MSGCTCDACHRKFVAPRVPFGFELHPVQAEELRRIVHRLEYTPDALAAEISSWCECGAGACGIEPYHAGHSSWCPVVAK